MKEKEIWKDIKGYEGIYQISSFGRVKTVSHKRWCVKNNSYSTIKEKIRTFSNYNKYYKVQLSKKNIVKNFYVHLLVWDHFGNSKRDGRNLQVDHINNNTKDNKISNLQVLKARDNIIKYTKTKSGTSIYPGVTYNSDMNKWISSISINGKRLYLGIFKNEINAYKAYLNKLEDINN